MPLPKPPAKRAAILTPADFEAQAAPKPGKRSHKTTLSAEPASSAELHLYDGSSEAAAPPTLKPEASAPAHHHVRRPAVEPQVRKPRGEGPPRLFVLDTNVLMHDPM